MRFRSDCRIEYSPGGAEEAESSMRAELTIAGAALASIMALLSPAQAAPKPDERVTITGCPYAGVTASCLMIKGSDGTVYDITGLHPKPREMNLMIRLCAVVTDKVSMCTAEIV